MPPSRNNPCWPGGSGNPTRKLCRAVAAGRYCDLKKRYAIPIVTPWPLPIILIWMDICQCTPSVRWPTYAQFRDRAKSPQWWWLNMDQPHIRWTMAAELSTKQVSAKSKPIANCDSPNPRTASLQISMCNSTVRCLLYLAMSFGWQGPSKRPMVPWLVSWHQK